MSAVQSLPSMQANRLATALLERHSPQEIADAIEVLIDVLDALSGDPDLEEVDEREPNGDERDIAWLESGAAMGSTGNGVFGMTEDDEDDDPAGQCDEDGVNTGAVTLFLHGTSFDGPGCPISDAGEADHRKRST